MEGNEQKIVANAPQAKNLMNLTAPMSSLSTPMRLSRAVENPFWIRTDRLAMKLFSGALRMRTMKPAKADQPSNL